jgi:hypothetical protein
MHSPIQVRVGKEKKIAGVEVTPCIFPHPD